ncbi:MAG: type I methionyl aminopeptidase [Anaerolineae bacterium]|jgi:methionyl aminopeptidase
MVILKSDDELTLMREAGRIVAEALMLIREQVRPGVSTLELDAVAEAHIRKRNAIPSFKGYPNNIRNGRPFPATICASINDELVHGIPGQRLLREGDIVSIDCGAIYEGYHGDSATTLPVGAITPEVQALLETTEEALYLGIAQARVGRRIGDVTSAIQRRVEDQGYSVVREYTSHCIGREMHEGFSFPNLGKAGRGMKLQRGMTIALEPMVNIGDWRTKLLDDGWTVSSLDGSLTAHFEHTIAVVDGEARILTEL